MSAAAISLQRVSKSYRLGQAAVEVLRDFTLEIQPHEFVSVVGASGCGKSTLLRLVLGLEQPEVGRVFIDGKPVRGPGLDRAIVFQDHRLLPWLSVENNVVLALHASALDGAGRKRKAREYLDRVGLHGYEQALPDQLSGGMAQRAAIARALVSSPQVLLLDEPFAALDALTRSRLQEELLQIWQQERITVLLVTHDIDEALYLSDRVVVLGSQPGHIRQVIPVRQTRQRSRDTESPVGLKEQILAAIAPARGAQETQLELFSAAEDEA